ncbi:FecR family protein [Cupriavidus sp. YAF13]|uniref:FecR family protein n=1 Tax=Cupriavidus sp. YAF13 TaxID=3233075 RepID=UPI003F926ED4
MKKPIDQHAVSNDALQEEARAWVRLLTSREVNAWDAQGFQRWLQSSPANKEAFNEAKRLWTAMKPAAGELLRANPGIAAAHSHASRPVQLGRRAFMGAAVSAAAVAAVAVVYPPLGVWPAITEWGADYRTAAGERQEIGRAGSVLVTLNTRTSVRRQMDDGEMVGLELINGQAAVDLFRGGRRFVVTAGVGRSVAESGRLDVKSLNGKVCVTCLEGAARVEHPSGIRALLARQQAIYDDRVVSSVVGAEPQEVSAWRTGEMVFRNTPLAEVVEEINRYRPGRVVLVNNAVRAHLVSGRFLITSLDAVLWQIERTYKLEATSLPGGLLVLS